MEPSAKAASTANPFAPPKALVYQVEESEYQFEPASRVPRLFARIIDGLICGIPVALGRWYFMPKELDPFFKLHPWLFSLMTGVIAVVAWESMFLLINFRGLSRDGKTIGKGICGVRIVRQDGTPADLLDAFVKRELPTQAAGLVPFVGGLVSLADTLLVFTPPRRCLHDLLAGTIVVDASSWRRREPLQSVKRPEPKSRRTCPYCGERYEPGALVCPSCDGAVCVVVNPKTVNRTLGTQQRLNKALKLHQYGDLEESLALYELTAQEDPDCLDAWLCILHTDLATPGLKQQAEEQILRIRSKSEA